MSGLLAAAAVAVAGLVVWALWKALATSRVDRQRARTEHLNRVRQHRLILAAAISVPAIIGLFVAWHFAGSPTPRVTEAAGATKAAESDVAGCQARNTGQLVLRRTSPTTITWTYTARGEAGGADRLSVLVDHRRADSVSAPSGTLTVGEAPVTVTVEGTGPGGRVHATCTG
ncbi:hypothetical protein Lfu02_79600 [Longispora fulva]|uniref:Uncharacterized protein n=1 Tax=Longispora fulva TaxID=619741 RepID=A0A8J7G6T0_9ACTN|nr:hypothetical protein [Longispora fulva]MBG6133985.1 hypothetical protein [Longispora fulva]GIG63588.1 hypothetical protein Lfu02_79600 [Longispora fulva]